VLPVEWKASADAELLEILAYISDRNEQAAEKLYERIQHDLEHASEHPYIFKSSSRVPGAREIVTHPNYLILYRVTSTCIEVVNVVHARREFPTQRS
jgi:addiction module RelE/StbE family toxin